MQVTLKFVEIFFAKAWVQKSKSSYMQQLSVPVGFIEKVL